MFVRVYSLIGVKNTALLGITTPESGHNYFSDLMNLKGADGEALFLCYKIVSHAHTHTHVITHTIGACRKSQC